MEYAARLILCWIVFIGFALAMFFTLKTGKFKWRGGPTVLRAERPWNYWFWTAMFLVMTGIVFVLAIVATISE